MCIPTVEAFGDYILQDRKCVHIHRLAKLDQASGYL